MPITITPEWQQMALYALGAAVLLTILFNIPKVGGLIRGLFSFAVLAFCVYLVLQQVPFDPNLGKMAARLGLDSQTVEGEEVRIQMSPDGHFWARATINGIERRMLIDSGATVTALSARTAEQAGVKPDAKIVPVMLRTASGVIRAQTGTVERIALGGIEAANLKVVTSLALGEIDVLGMNFLSQLASWRVEGRTLIMTPAKDGEAADVSEPSRRTN
jgi:aspartyl protease family protein